MCIDKVELAKAELGKSEDMLEVHAQIRAGKILFLFHVLCSLPAKLVHHIPIPNTEPLYPSSE